jgi:hypothetical protein
VYIPIALANATELCDPAAIAEFHKALATGRKNPWPLSSLAQVYALEGERRESELVFKEILDSARNQSDVAIELASTSAAAREERPGILLA